MRWCVVGAGAIGSFVGGKLALAGEDVVLLARGAQEEALRARGLTIREHGGTHTLAMTATHDPHLIGPVDTIILALKAHRIASVLASLPPLYHDGTTVVAMQNGIPWWYTAGHPVAAGWDLQTVDPGGRIARAIGTQRAIAAAVYVAASVPEPGVVKHTHGLRITLGEPDGARSARLMEIGDALARAGFAIDLTDVPRVAVWEKLLGNAAFNPISALTRARMRSIASSPRVLALIRDMMEECLAVAAALGDAPAVDIDARIAASPLDDTRTSMLQDYEAGRRLELDPLLGAVVELGEKTGVPTPKCALVYGLCAVLDEEAAAS